MGCLIVYYLGFNSRRWSRLWKGLWKSCLAMFNL